MKKLLALVLALVMTLGLATVGSNAANWSDLKDKDKVDESRQEAFQVLNAIKVFEGNDQDLLTPDAQLTRAEAAKIIATLNLGKTTAESLPKTGDKFTDVAASNWAAGYISYCESNGIIAGRGDGTFDPQGDLTVAAFTKMLLVSLGYNAETEKFLGADWQINTIALANRVGLFNGFDGTLVATDKVMRADAAQMAFNTLKTPLVTYANYGILGQYNNPIPSNAAQGTAVYMTTAARDTQTISTATINDGSARGTYMVEFAEQNFPKLTRNTHDIDDWGRPATTWTLDRNLIGTYNNTDLLVFESEDTVKGSEIYTALGGSTFLRMYANDLTKTRVQYNFYVDGVKQEGDDWDAIYNKINATGTELGISGAGTKVEVYIDDDTYYNYGVTMSDTAKIPVVTIVAINTWLAELMTDAKDGAAMLGIYTADDTPEARKASILTKDYKEGDWVLVRFTRDDNVVRWVGDPEITKNATIGTYTTDSDSRMDTVTIDGEDHSITNTAHTNSKILKTYKMRELKGFTYDLYMDVKGNIYGIQYNTKDTNLVFVTGFEVDSTVLAASTVKANLIFADGSMKLASNVRLSDVAGASAKTFINLHKNDTAAGKCAALNSWFTYSKADDGTITLVDVIPAADSTATADAYQWSNNVYDGDTVADISNSKPTLSYVTNDGTKMTAVADDNTIYISAVATNDVTNGAIAKVTGVTVGKKNVNILTSSPKADGLTNFKNAVNGVGANLYENVFYVFDSNRYIVAAVALTEKTTADHLAYIVSNVSSRSHTDGVGYVDTYSAIIDGESKPVTIKVDSLTAGFDTTKKLSKNTLYAISYDKTGEYIVLAEQATNAPADLTSDKNANRGYAVINVDGKKVDSVVYGDLAGYRTTNVLYAKDTAGKTVGYIGANDPGKFFVYKDGTLQGGEAYPHLSAAWNVATADSGTKKFTVTDVYAMTDKATGNANTVIIVASSTATTSTTIGTNSAKVVRSDKENGYLNPWFYTAQYDKETGASTILTLAEKRDALKAVMIADGCTDISFATKTVGGVTTSVVSYTDKAGNRFEDNTCNLLQVYKVTVLGDKNTYYTTGVIRNAQNTTGTKFPTFAMVGGYVVDATKEFVNVPITVGPPMVNNAIRTAPACDVTLGATGIATADAIDALNAMLVDLADSEGSVALPDCDILVPWTNGLEDLFFGATTKTLTIPKGVTVTVNVNDKSTKLGYDGEYIVAVGETINVNGNLVVNGDFRINGDVNVGATGKLTVNGDKFVVAGTSLKLTTKGAKVVVNAALEVTGTLITVAGTTLEVNDKMNIESAGTIAIAGSVKVADDLTIGKTNTANVNITSDATAATKDAVAVNGDIVVDSASTLTLDGAVSADELKVADTGATVNVTSAVSDVDVNTLENKGTITVNNANAQFAASATDNDGTITVTNAKSVALGETDNSTGNIADNSGNNVVSASFEDAEAQGSTTGVKGAKKDIVILSATYTKSGSNAYVQSGDSVTIKFNHAVKADPTVTIAVGTGAASSATVSTSGDTVTVNLVNTTEAGKITLTISGVQADDTEGEDWANTAKEEIIFTTTVKNGAKLK